MFVEPVAGDSLAENINPVGRLYDGFSTMICTPGSLSQEVGLCPWSTSRRAALERGSLEGRFYAIAPCRGNAVQYDPGSATIRRNAVLLYKNEVSLPFFVLVEYRRWPSITYLRIDMSLLAVLLFAATMALSLWATMRVRQVYGKFSQFPASSGLSGAQTAARILRQEGLAAAAGDVHGFFEPRHNTDPCGKRLGHIDAV